MAVRYISLGYPHSFGVLPAERTFNDLIFNNFYFSPIMIAKLLKSDFMIMLEILKNVKFEYNDGKEFYSCKYYNNGHVQIDFSSEFQDTPIYGDRPFPERIRRFEECVIYYCMNFMALKYEYEHDIRILYSNTPSEILTFQNSAECSLFQHFSNSRSVMIAYHEINENSSWDENYQSLKDFAELHFSK